MRTAVVPVLGALVLASCSSSTPPVGKPSAPRFVNQLWRVAQSSGVEPGTLYAFFEDGTLLITSSHGTPAVGRWRYATDTLTLVEEGIAYPAEVDRLTADTFAITVHSPGEPLSITFIRETAP